MAQHLHLNLKFTGNVAITTANYYSNYSELGNRFIKVNMVTTVALVIVVIAD